MGISLAQAMENAARQDSIDSLGYAYGFEYFRYNGEIWRAPYENPISTLGYRQGARWEARELIAHLLDTLSDGEGNPIANPEGRYQIRRSIGTPNWYVTDTALGGGGIQYRPGKVKGEFTPYFKTRKGAENYAKKLQDRK